MRSASKILTFIFAIAGMSAAQSTVPVRLLTAVDSGTTKNLREFDYNVSVDQYLDVSSIRNVICQVVRSEKPSGYEILNFGVYYKLDKYIAEADRELPDSTRHREQRIAQYHWNKDTPKDSRRLVVSKDAKGKSLAQWQYVDFNHAKSCK